MPLPTNPPLSVDLSDEKDRKLVTDHVEKLLAHPLFRHGKRLPMFLQHVTRLATLSPDDAPKERTLGIEIFGRRPDYDTNADPVVRVTATELRKKLAQYYHADGRDDLLEIELPPGSYLPRFRRTRDEVASDVAPVQPPVVPPAEPAVEFRRPAPVSQLVEPHPTSDVSTGWRTVAIGLFGLLVVLAGAWAWSLHRKTSPASAFWHALSGTSGNVTVVLPVIGTASTNAPPPAEPTFHNISVAPNLSLEDTTIAARIAGQLERNNLRYILTSSSETNLAQLRNGAAIFVGALDNEWTMRAGQEIPFHIERTPDHHTGRIIEGNSESPKQIWAIDIDTPHRKIDQDYGIVARFRSRLTGEPLIVVAGISSQGTQAAGELLTDPDALAGLLSRANGAENFEGVIKTEAVDGRAGPPQIVAFKSW